MRQIRRSDGERKEKDVDAYMSNALGCEVMLVTSDNKAVLLWNKSVGGLIPDRFKSRCGGRFNGPSTSPEPERAGVDGAVEATAKTQQSIVAELFDAALRAVQHGLYISRDKLSEPRLIGCLADSRHYKPELLFLVHTTLDVPSVRKCFEAKAPDPDALDFWPTDSITDCAMQVTCNVRAAAESFVMLVGHTPVWKEHAVEAPAAAAEKAAPAAAEAEKPKGTGIYWNVVGGADKGVLVREGTDLKTAELGRLMKGARVEELERQGSRLKYKKVEGQGPDVGWVSVALGGKELLVKG